MRLNLGSGDYPAKGWVNVDCHPGPGVNVVTDLAETPWPFEDASAEAVYAGHVLEHLPEDVLPNVLAEIRRVLAPRGELCVVGPDLDRIEEGSETWCSTHAGARSHDRVGGEHLWDCTEAKLVNLLTKAGFTPRPVPVAALEGTGWPVVSYVDWQCAVLVADSGVNEIRTFAGRCPVCNGPVFQRRQEADPATAEEMRLLDPQAIVPTVMVNEPHDCPGMPWEEADEDTRARIAADIAEAAAMRPTST